jgi:hypothetical protein
MSNPSKPVSAEHIWEEGWEGHERLQRQRLAKLSFEEKLEWLEEAQKVAAHLQQSARRADDTASAGK